MSSPPSLTPSVLQGSNPAPPESTPEAGSLSHLPWYNFHALLVGIDNYKDGSINNLSGAVRDIKSMERFLVDAFDVPSGSTLDIRTLKNEAAIATNIVKAIQQLMDDDKIKQNDIILIHYAGHGAKMPPPEGWPGWTPTPPLPDGWPEDVEIQCIVAHDVKVSEIRPQKYYATGVVPDRTLNVLLRELADKKGNNITVILDCCHSGSGTRDSKNVGRSVELKDPHGKRVPILGDNGKEIWGPFFLRGAVLDWKYRHAGLGSHVLLAACGQKERASDSFSFTQALLEYFQKAYLGAVSYDFLIKNIRRIDGQSPLCEGNNVKSILFDLKNVHLGRLAFDVVMGKLTTTLGAGEMLGITSQTKFDVYTSKAITLREERVGQFEVCHVSATYSSFKALTVTAHKFDLSAAVASPAVASADTFSVHIGAKALRTAVERAVTEESPEDQYGRPQIDLNGAIDSADLIIAVNDEKVTFCYQASSEIAKLGLPQLLYTIPVEPVDPPRLRRVLRAGTHFFKYLRNAPTQKGIRLRDFVEVRIHELQETDEIAIVHDKLARVLEPTRQLEPAANGAYNVTAARGDEDAYTAPQYGIELVNKSRENGLFVWVFFFDCGTLQILQYHEPRVAKGGSLVDPTLPSIGANLEPVPVALNYRQGTGKVLKMQLREAQAFDLGFLRIFLSTRYHGSTLSTIVQDAPLAFDHGVWRGHQRSRLLRASLQRSPGKAWESGVPDLWDVLTIPLIQRAAV